METGTLARTVASTNMNATSSRAHTVFQIILTQTKVDRDAGKATDKVANHTAREVWCLGHSHVRLSSIVCFACRVWPVCRPL